jgi:hypothetical protein
MTKIDLSIKQIQKVVEQEWMLRMGGSIKLSPADDI